MAIALGLKRPADPMDARTHQLATMTQVLCKTTVLAEWSTNAAYVPVWERAAQGAPIQKHATFLLTPSLMMAPASSLLWGTLAIARQTWRWSHNWARKLQLTPLCKEQAI